MQSLVFRSPLSLSVFGRVSPLRAPQGKRRGNADGVSPGMKKQTSDSSAEPAEAARLRPLLLRPRKGRTAALLTLPQEGHRGHVGPVPPKLGAAVTLQGLLGSHAIQNTGAAA